MKRKRFSVEQIVAVLKQAEAGIHWDVHPCVKPRLNESACGFARRYAGLPLPPLPPVGLPAAAPAVFTLSSNAGDGWPVLVSAPLDFKVSRSASWPAWPGLNGVVRNEDADTVTPVSFLMAWMTPFCADATAVGLVNAP